MRISVMAWVIVTGFLIGSSAGCVRTQPTHYYILSSIDSEGRSSMPSIDGPDVRIGLGPLTLPSYLDRAGIVTRITPNTLNIADFDNWAEPLHQNVMSVVSENLSWLLGTDNIVTYPWKRSHTVDYQLVLDVIEFDVNSAGNALLFARWSVVGDDGETVIATNKGRYVRTPAGKDYHHLVQALSETLEDMSREIADRMTALLTHE
ncbi:MAG: PqiC family protein [Nitrospirales bacterium]|nr:membrane integrity-associated transporter subunit PqiC [Nitrospira sp.]MDR4501315.1 PqiC family protein [Nitrospirales bacterium]